MRNLWNEKHVKCVLFIVIISVHVQVTSTSLSAVQFKDQNGSANQSIAIPGIIILLSYSSKLIIQWSTKQIPLNWTHVPDTWTCGDTRGNNSHLGGSWFLKWPNQWLDLVLFSVMARQAPMGMFCVTTKMAAAYARPKGWSVTGTKR